MAERKIAENVLGTIGTVFWCIQLIPQIIRNYKVKNCEGITPLMTFLWAASGVPFSIYFFITDGTVPMKIQPQLYTFFCTISFTQSLYYEPVGMSVNKIIIIVGSFYTLSIGMEAGFILWLTPLYEQGVTWPSLIFGIVASILLALGLVPPYFELAKRKGRVVGINIVFLLMDSSGALFSILSIVVGDMDLMSIILYSVVLALEVGILLSHSLWVLRFSGSDADSQIEDVTEMIEWDKMSERQSRNDYATFEVGEEEMQDSLPVQEVRARVRAANYDTVS